MADKKLRDPLGRQVILHNHTWIGHILRRHRELRARRNLVEQTITKPLEIRFSAADSDCRVYFGSGPRKTIMTAVVADVVRGFVKTAHFVKSAKGVIEWSRQTPSKGS